MENIVILLYFPINYNKLSLYTSSLYCVNYNFKVVLK